MNDTPQTPPNLTRYLDVQQAFGPSWGSDGRCIAFLSNLTGVPQV